MRQNEIKVLFYIKIIPLLNLLPHCIIRQELVFFIFIAHTLSAWLVLSKYKMNEPVQYCKVK